jgi:hypothetical protein
MLLDRWRARRAIATRTPPSPVSDPAAPALRTAVETLAPLVRATDSLGDPSWHYRWEGELQLVGLDATRRSVTDVRQRLVRLVHEDELRHMARRARRVLAVVLCAPHGGEGLRGWHARLDDDQGEVGVSDWRAARRKLAVLAVDAADPSRCELVGGDRAIRQAVDAWRAVQAAPAAPG